MEKQITPKEKLISGLLNFKKAFAILNESWRTNYKDADLAVYSYPFSENFDELCKRVDEWTEDAISEVKGRGNTLFYIIDLDERGLFKAHVENEQGKIIYELSGQELEDGFMKHKNDTTGLENYVH